MASLAEIRAKLMSQQAKQEGGGGRDNSIYPFWNIPDNTTAILRFLPDNDPNNTFFWVERLVIRLPFSGVDDDPQKNVIVQVPCMEMYGKSCPVLTEIRPWFKDPELDTIARKYWKKKSYIFQGFVVDDPMGESEKPENPIRRFVINSSIYNIIKQSLMDPEMEDLPIDFVNGRDFRLTKGRKGQYADYSTSKWSMKTRALSDEEAEAIENFGLFELSSFLPKEPNEEELEAIKEMFQASVDGEPYDSSRWSQYYKPSGMGFESNDSEKQTSKPTPKKAASETKKQAKQEVQDEPEDNDSEDEVEEETKPQKATANEALAKLKSRTTKKADPEPEVEDDADEDEKPETPAKPSTKQAKADPSEILAALRQRAKKS